MTNKKHDPSPIKHTSPQPTYQLRGRKKETTKHDIPIDFNCTFIRPYFKYPSLSFRLVMFLYFLIATQLLISFTAAQECISPNPNTPKVFITFSSLASTNLLTRFKTERQLELNWYNVSPQEGDYVALYLTDPQLNSTQPIVKIQPINQSKNHYLTSIQLPRFNFTLSNLTSQCIGYWIAYLRNDVIVSQNCAKIEPQWMWESRNTIGNLSLPQMMIPGTHNSGSYGRYRGLKSENVLTRYKLCHDEDILQQLIYGIRALDLRISSFPKESDEFWIVHDKIKMYPLREIIENIKTFIASSKDIIILDLHRFPEGFDNVSTHERLISYLDSELGQWTIPNSLSKYVTLNQLWDMDKRILVMYSNSVCYSSYKAQLLWCGLSQKWGNTMKIDELKSFLEKWMVGWRDWMWASMAQLTPTPWTIVTSPRKGVRGFADDINREITKWFRDEWSEEANVVHTDYFHGNGVVQVAVDVNKRRACKEKMVREVLGDY